MSKCSKVCLFSGLKGYNASVFYSYFVALGLGITVEGQHQSRPSGHGRAVRRERRPVRVQSRGAGAGGGGEVFPVGVVFSRETRNVVGFGVE